MGMQLLERKGLTKHVNNVLNNPESTPLDMRSVLWCLGYYGSTKEGFQRLNNEGIIKRIIDMSMNCPTLSLRGTCRYVMNMFCHSEEGRNHLTLSNFTVNKKLLSCFPNDPQNLLFKFQDKPKPHISENEELWKEYTSNLQPMNASKVLPNSDDKRMFEAVSLLINSLSSKHAITQIKDMMKNNSKIVCSFELLHNVVTLMSFFKLKYEARKTIQFIFE